MAEVDLAFLARQNERIMADNASMRDELRVQTAPSPDSSKRCGRCTPGWRGRTTVRRLEDAGH
jgi:hypothetical protein